MTLSSSFGDSLGAVPWMTISGVLALLAGIVPAAAGSHCPFREAGSREGKGMTSREPTSRRRPIR
ncbi:hypothetical protein [Thermosporothrix hazakensis]|uniref:hypothetical protein n=1 Tax=Thermosporothrix hazakensis TaxID=644383 RepID=UPI001B86A476|nr:hypothetical protein [Thermosporothrix hazakensis]